MSSEHIYPNDVDKFPLWRSLPRNEELLELILARTTANHFKGFRFIENNRGPNKEFVIYASPAAIKSLENIIHSSEYYTLKYAYAGDNLDRFYRINSSWIGQDLVKLNYLFWKRKAKSSNGLYNYWVNESKKTSIAKVSDICLANAFLYRHSYFGALMMGEEVRLGIKPIIPSTGPLKLTYELMESLVSKKIGKSASSQQ